jgi:hypothetical protein
MNKENTILNSFIGIFIGNFIACLILILAKHSDYMRFWSYMGFFIFPVINFIAFLLPLGIYMMMSNIFKTTFIANKHFFIVAFFFSCFYTLGNFYLILPFMNKIGRNVPPLLFSLIDLGTPYLLFPLVLFLLILTVYKLLKLKS